MSSKDENKQNKQKSFLMKPYTFYFLIVLNVGNSMNGIPSTCIYNNSQLQKFY